jgi:hypothetical protein
MSKGGEELEVICYSLWGKRRRGQRSEVIRKSEKVAFLRGRDALVLKESGHPAHIFIVAGASCSRPSMERPAPCFAKPMTPPLL